MKTRLLGCALLTLCALLIWQLYGAVNSPPVHEATVGETILAALVTLSGLPGAMMIAVGDDLFRVPE